MSTFPFPSSPSNGDTYTLGSNTYTYESATDQWVGVVSGTNAGVTALAQIFTSNGTFTVPNGVSGVKVTVVGGGGGGALGSTESYGGQGGGAGAAAIKWLTGLTPGNTITVTIGSGGIGGAIPTDGGYSRIASGTQSITTITANGGYRGWPFGSPNPTGGAGGSATGGDINLGGAAADNQGPLGGSVGASSIFGGGGSAGGGGVTPAAGTAPGAGGGGGGLGDYGAAGANGIVIFEYQTGGASGSGGSAAWVNFDGSTGTIAGSYNVSSVTRNGTGDYTVNFSTPMANTNYAVVAMGAVEFSFGVVTPLTTSVRLVNGRYGQPAGTDVQYTYVVVYS